jgi:hypothetical protein
MNPIEFEEALSIARKCVEKKTGDRQPMLLRYEISGDHVFQFQTTSGDHHIIIDRFGKVGHCYIEEKSEPSESPFEIPQRVAVENALAYLREGRVQRVKARSGGYEVEVERSGTLVQVFVDRKGTVHSPKRSQLSRDLAADIE